MRHAFRLALALTLFPALPAVADPAPQVTVMTRNIYLGADVGPAMKLLPNFAAATQFMWGQVHQTDFSQRAPKLADEIKNAKPDVIALQEATTWLCAPHAWSRPVPVYDFTQQLLDAVAATGHPYVVAQAAGTRAFNTGFSINAIPGVTIAHDPEVFQPLFGTDSAACGFQIADALLVRADLADHVTRAGTSEYEQDYTIIPTVMNVYRGYSWADIDFSGTTVRFVATHLESLFDEGKVPPAKAQADQLVADVGEGQMPVVVMGDFNSDPRDPRPSDDANLGGQPVAGAQCAAQAPLAQAASADDTCSAYWTMVHAGFTDSGPNARTNLSWGYSATLDGPDSARPEGFTDRLDYVFTKNMGVPLSAHLVGNTYPTGTDMWACGQTMCAPSDHAGLVASIALPTNSVVDAAPPGHGRVPFGFWKAFWLLAAVLLVWRVRRRMARRAARNAVTDNPTD